MIAPKLITAATVEPVSVPEVKEHLRVDFTDEDAKFLLFIRAARDHFETVTGRTLHQTTWEIALDGFPANNCGIRLPRAAPLVSVTSVKYLDSAGAETTWGSSNYIVDTYEMPGVIVPAYNVNWPSFTPYPINPVRIRYVAGIENGSPQGSYPDEGIRQCLMEMVGSLYENRESVVLSDKASIAGFIKNPVTQQLLENYRIDRAF